MILRDTRVKICGVKTAAAFDAVVDGQAEYLGFNFFEPSPRYVTPAQAADLSARHQGGPERVGLFVGADIEAIRIVLDQVKLDILQLYADAAHCQEVRARFGLPVWRAIGVSVKSELPVDAEGLDGFVIEAKAPPGATRPGGNAMLLNWGLVSDWQAPGFWLLAGGLTPKNVAQAIAQSNAIAVDVSSGVESAPGEKSPELIREFIASVRNATYSA